MVEEKSSIDERLELCMNRIRQDAHAWTSETNIPEFLKHSHWRLPQWTLLSSAAPTSATRECSASMEAIRGDLAALPEFWWRPEKQYRLTLQCPRCHSGKLVSNGLHRHGPKLVSGLETDYYLVFWDYRCQNTKCSRRWTGIHKDFFDILPEYVRLCFPAFQQKDSLLDKTLCDHFQRAVVSGMTQADALRHVEEIQAKRHARNEQLYLSASLHMRQTRQATLLGHFQPSVSASVSSFPRYAPQCKLKNLSDWYQVTIQLFYLSWFYRFIASTPAKLIKVDHTFKITKRVKVSNESMHEACFTAMNELGLIVGIWFVDSTEFDTVIPVLETLKARFQGLGGHLSHCYIDDCCRWRTKLKSVWGDLKVHLDPWHFIERFRRAIDKDCKLTDAFMRDITRAIFVVQKFTSNELREHYARFKLNPDKARQLSDDIKVQEVNKMRHIPDAATLQSALCAVLKKYSSLKDIDNRPLFAPEQHRQMLRMVENHAECLADPTDYTMHVVHGVTQQGRLQITTPRFVA